MALAKITEISGTGIHVPGDDIDTDRIIPARFMKCVTFDGLGDYLFHDVRFDTEGKERDHSLNEPAYSKASILISGSNFGCGSSASMHPNQFTEQGFGLLSQEILLKSFSVTLLIWVCLVFPCQSKIV